MAETVYLKDGSMEVILEDVGIFLEKLIREHMGDDVARCFLDYISELNEETTYAQESISEQERSADGYLQLCHGALDTFGELLRLLDSPRLNRNALRAVAQNGYNDLNNNL